MNKRTSFLSALLVVFILAGSLAGHSPLLRANAQGIDPQGKVEPQVLEALQLSGAADYVIVMAEQADLSAAYSIADWNERGRYVYDTLSQTAARSQKRAIAQLQARGLRYQSFILGNQIYVHGGTQRAIESLLSLAEVGRVRAPVTVKLNPVEMFEVQGAAQAQAEVQAGPTWGLTDAHAPEFWSTFGRHGEGIVVANIDTGVQADHPALADAYHCAGGNLLDEKCWHDAIVDAPESGPQDDQGHGTHTMGTMVGSNDPALPHQVGMAPGAQWIACRAFIDNTATEDDLLECAQWILAPAGDPANRPHVVNNSWGGDSQDEWFQEKVQAWAAAGIFATFSAGNEGSSCNVLGSPADYPEGFTVTAHDNRRTIASFASKGGNTAYLKPNLSAPGELVLSAYPEKKGLGEWLKMNGTSMAAPHVAGAVALLWSLKPDLVGNLGLTAALLQSSAAAPPPGDCGAPESGGGNYTYGYGFLDVYRAGLLSLDLKPAVYLPLIANYSIP